MAKDRAPLAHKDFLKISRDYEAAASAANLIYVSDKDEGISREKKGTGFTYKYKGETVAEEKDLDRIKKLVIPPAWTNVWICKSPNGHVQATGYDVKGRKQYRYHPRWNSLQQETKFHRMYEFGRALTNIRKQIQKDIAQEGFPETKVLASVVGLMEQTYIRVGNETYEKENGSYGLTTLKNRHVNVKGDTVKFSFKGKKGVYHEITLKNKKFARIVKQCKAIPGRELFQYQTESGEWKKVDSGQVNQYIKDCAGADFTTKDFRTWAGTLMMMRILKHAAPCENQSAYQKTLVEAFRQVSGKLGNTVAVCKKYYVHPQMVNLYQQQELEKIFERSFKEAEGLNGLSAEEKLMMNILDLIHREQVNPKLTEKLLKAAIKKEVKIKRTKRAA